MHTTRPHPPTRAQSGARSRPPAQRKSGRERGAENGGIDASAKTKNTVTKTKKPRIGLLLAAVAAVILVGFIATFSPLRSWIQQREAAADLAGEVIAMEESNAALKEQLRRWEDPDYVAKQARERLGYVRKGETVYVVVDPKLAPATAAESSGESEKKIPWFLAIAAAANSSPDSAPLAPAALETTGKQNPAPDTSKENQQ